MERNRAIFLDRDGVLNRAIVREGKPYPPDSLAQLELLPGVEDACRALRARGFLLIVVTNQPDIARGTKSGGDVDAINEHLRVRLALDAVKVCPHDDADGCGCRKPRPGLLTEAARELRIDLERSYMVGDRWRDIEAGQSAGCRTVWIRYPWAERQPERPDATAVSLSEAVKELI